MLTGAYGPCDGVTLARLVRAIGLSARRSLKRPPDEADGREILMAIEALESELAGQPSSELARWVKSLRRRVEDHHGPIA